ncbi:MAG: RNA 2',3'-cyclic phosphodiesterase [Clostridiaceae bacterium]|nr:RNA 2',3'-cyclic phosphodiesterase [Clostridiaceae bacterium]
MRLFLAIPLSDIMRDLLDNTIASLRRDGVRGNFTRPENLHITLHFLGEQPSAAVETLSNILLAAVCPAFPLTISGLGRFDSGVLWAGILPSKELTLLYKDLRVFLQNAGFSTENRAYHPHLTLAREYILPPDYLFPSLQPQSMTVDCIELMESSRIAGKLCYSPLSMVRLT